MARIRRSGVKGDDWLRAAPPPISLDPNQNLRQRLAALQQLRPQNIQDMMCFIAYDIESNKVRTQIAKYLIRQGCHRVQKSVYVAQLPRSRYREMVEALRVINELYDNEDSIFFLPVGEDNLNRMEIVGRDLYLEVAREQRHTLIL
jgi:CRISPR-associated protein Cas2